MPHWRQKILHIFEGKVIRAVLQMAGCHAIGMMNIDWWISKWCHEITSISSFFIGNCKKVHVFANVHSKEILPTWFFCIKSKYKLHINRHLSWFYTKTAYLKHRVNRGVACVTAHIHKIALWDESIHMSTILWKAYKS